jgi:hypothetical protein
LSAMSSDSFFLPNPNMILCLLRASIVECPF